MSKVHLLSPDVISKIAAGEVIERPASVVKELIENAFDAQTDSVEIHLQDAGKSLIHVKDTGSGIEKEDVEKIFSRHATSKIQSASDLESINSLGFRGEALYSIAAIADVTLRSKTPEAETGWEIHIRGGKQLDLKPCTMSNGTEIEVRELFFNTPARRKFLKSNTTELNQILNVIIPYALLHINCRFLVKHQQKSLLELAPSSSHIARLAQTLHQDEKHIVETRLDREEMQTSIHMILGDINIKRSQRDMQFVFVNGRPVVSKAIGFHMNQIYQLIFPPKSYPCFAVFINIPASQIDVNIHPTKREVKIKSEYQLTSVLRSMAEQTLMSLGQAKQATQDPAFTAQEKDESPIERAVAGTHNAATTFDYSIPAGGLEAPIKESSSEQYAFPKETQSRRAAEGGGRDSDPFWASEKDLKSKLFNAHYVGSFIKKFLLFEVDQSLLVVDQHAAQERIIFEHLKTQMEEGRVEVQNLLSPILIKLTIQELNVWEEIKDELEKIGLSSTMFDDETLALHTTPVLLKDPEGALRHILSGETTEHCDHETIARRACRSSVMAGDRMTKEQAEYQREQLLKCRDPYTCPHGRPTVIEMDEKFLDKQFLRT